MIADGAENHEGVSVRGSSSSDNLKLILAALMFVLTCMTTIGAVPIAIMAIGFVLSLRSGDIGNVKATTRFFQAIMLLAPIGVTIGMAYYYRNDNAYYNDSAHIGLMASAVAAFCFAYIILLEVLWIAPVTRQLPIWLSRKKDEAKSDGESRIIKRDSLAPYSVADELIKWSKLHAEGLVSDDEFEEARTKLLAKK